MLKAGYFIDSLGLEPHVEGGYCREVYKSRRWSDGRPLSSTIYYLLKSGQVSRFHRLKSDELWFYHYGSPLLVHQLDVEGALTTQTLGLGVEQGERPQITVPANRIFGAEVSDPDSFCLVSCVVSPGFDYRDFELLPNEELLQLFPRHHEIIKRLSGAELSV